MKRHNIFKVLFHIKNSHKWSAHFIFKEKSNNWLHCATRNLTKNKLKIYQSFCMFTVSLKYITVYADIVLKWNKCFVVFNYCNTVTNMIITKPYFPLYIWIIYIYFIQTRLSIYLQLFTVLQIHTLQKYASIIWVLY